MRNRFIWSAVTSPPAGHPCHRFSLERLVAQVLRKLGDKSPRIKAATSRSTPNNDLLKNSLRYSIQLMLVILMGLVLTACTRLGPKTIVRDRSEYGTVIGTSWKDQTLLNIVKTRYGDLPVFLDIGQIVAGYSIETKAYTGFVDGVIGGAEGVFSNHPTITYTPMTGPKFIRELLLPIPPDVVFLAVESGYPADIVFSITIATMSGMRNHKLSGRATIEGDPEFFRALHLFRTLQAAGRIGVRIKPGENEKKYGLLEIFFNVDEIPQNLIPVAEELKKLLGLNLKLNEFKIVFGTEFQGNTGISIHTRSVYQIMSEFSAQIDVPHKDSVEGRAYHSSAKEHHKMLRIKSSPTKPDDAFVAINYRNNYYYIDDRDHMSKRVFGYLMFILSLTDTGGREIPPLLSIPIR